MADDIAKLLLRLAVGGMMLFHGIYKVTDGIESIKRAVTSNGLYEFIAYGVYVGEILAPIFLIIGWQSRFWAGVVVFNMAMAIYLTKLGSLLKVGDYGAWSIENSMFFLVTALVISLIGSGRYAIMRD